RCCASTQGANAGSCGGAGISTVIDCSAADAAAQKLPTQSKRAILRAALNRLSKARAPLSAVRRCRARSGKPKPKATFEICIAHASSSGWDHDQGRGRRDTCQSDILDAVLSMAWIFPGRRRWGRAWMLDALKRLDLNLLVVFDILLDERSVTRAA